MHSQNGIKSIRKRGFGLSIRHRLSLLFSSLVGINLMAAGIGALALNHAIDINPLSTKIASQRGTAFKLAYMANIRTQKTNVLDQVALDVAIKEEMEQFDRWLIGLHGGSKELGLGARANPTILAQLKKVEDTWRIYRRTVENYLAATPERREEYLTDINNLSNFIANQLDSLANLVDEQIADSAQKSQFLLFVVLILSLLTVPVAFLMVSQILRDLTQITQTARLMASGDLNVRAVEPSRDEVGVLASTLNTMATQIGGLLQGLEARSHELENTLAYVSAIIDNLADALLVTDPDCRIARFNPALLAMFGLDDTDVMGRDCQVLSNPKVAELVEQTQGRPREVFTAQIELRNGRVGQALATAIAKDVLKDAGNETLGAVILIRDITVEKEIDRMKTDFISTVSHELRTPLTSILGFASLIKDKLDERIFPLIQADDRQTKKIVNQVGTNINIIVSEAERLTSLIDDVLDIAKMEAGKIDWQMQPYGIEDIIDRAIAATSSLFEGRNIELLKDVQSGMPDVMGDRDRLLQVFINLISNAIKFTDTGSCTVKARQQENEILIGVIDTGVGIAAADKPKVFEKFKQVGETLTDKPKGTGLGLPICKQIVEHHGGRIWVESDLGLGSTFFFTLPISLRIAAEVEKLNINTIVRQLKESIVHTDPSPVNNFKTILVVDDDAHIRELLRQELEAEGYAVQEAKDGMDAITQVKTTKPDLIVLDVMMPQINGFDVAAVLKNNPQTMGIPIIILSIIEDKERGYRLGIDRYLKKPINREELLNDIGMLLDQGISNKKVLVVDKDASNVKILSEVLQSQGYAVTEAYNGQECIDKALSVKPDMIIVDSVFSEQHNLVKTLRFEKGLENVFFVLLGKSKEDPLE
ncbi:response regulator [Argonema galeatum]|uniref:response regulator n=1 Tax=Argonema galeatum TaxID=2942762 RepID=UPI0020129D44|nr:response regulator [Argonema galeatum]MCL1468455.1 response regulator [Argonema galeatum A003/A1]